MRFEIEYTFADYLSSQRVLAGRGRRAARLVSWVIYGVICLGVGLFGVLRTAGPAGWWVLPALFALTLAASPWLDRLQHRRVWRRSVAVGGVAPRAAVEFHGDGVLIEGRSERTFIAWAGFSHWGETAELFLLYQGPGLFRYFPKRAFGDTAARVRELLATCVGNTTYRPEPPGFEVVQVR